MRQGKESKIDKVGAFGKLLNYIFRPQQKTKCSTYVEVLDISADYRFSCLDKGNVTSESLENHPAEV